MKNLSSPLIALSFAVASALALADSEQYKQDWFKGIGGEANTSISGLKTTNGSWQFPATEGCATVNGSSELVLALDVDDEGEAEEATFTVTDKSSATADDAFPVQRLVVRGVFTPIAAQDLLTGKAMSNKIAKVGFAIVNVGSETDTYRYYAWVGGGSTAEQESKLAVSDWVDLGPASYVTTAKTIVIDLDYSAADVVTAKFAVGADEAAAETLTEGGLSLEGSALLTALDDKVIASVSCTGSGTLSALQGKYQYAVAEVDGVKYATVDAAVKAAATSEDGTVTVVRNLKDGETVAAANGVTIKAGSNDVTLSDKVTTSDGTKEVVEVNGVVTVRTPKDILDAVMVGTAPKSLTAGAEEADAKVAKFRDFLNKHCGTAYRKAGTTAGVIAEALNADEKSSGRKLWQSYALGVEPDAAVTPQQVAQDTDKDNITLSLPIKPTGDFTVTCAVGNGAAQELTGEAPTFKVPMATGHYAVTITLE